MSDQVEVQAEAAPVAEVAPVGGTTQTEADGYQGGEQDFAAALAELTGAEPPKAEPVAEPVKAAAVPVPVAAPAQDSDMKAILAKLTKLEFERDQAAERATKLEQEATQAKAAASEWDGVKSNPIEVLKKLGYTQEQVLDFVTNGPRAQHPEEKAREAKFAEYEARLAKAEAAAQQVLQQREQEKHQAGVQSYISTIPAAVKGAADKFPTLVSFYEGNEAEMGQHLYNYSQDRLKTEKGFTLGQAAAEMETALLAQKARFLKGSSAGKGAPVPPKATLTNAAPVAGSRPAGDDLDDEALLNAALAALKG
jgi:hypothetical protein